MAATIKYSSIRFFVAFIFTIAIHSLRAQTPVASFTTDKNIGCAPLLVNFSNTSTGAVSYAWSFGNSNNSTIANPTTIFLSNGIYTVTLIATSATGIKDTSKQIITVVNDPIAAFSANPLSGCEGVNTINFVNSSAHATTYAWDFGDGNSSTLSNPTHTYLNPGTYNIKLIASNNYGCLNIKIRNSYITIYPQPKANFSANITSSCDINTAFTFTSTSTGISSWKWDFGDGQTSTLQSPTHSYTNAGAYTVSLIVTNSNGCKDTLVKNNYINIGSSLVPSFTMSDSAGCGPLPITFNATVPNATSWTWDFGDGGTSTLQNPSHTFNSPGNYPITLAVTTQSGCNGSVTIPALVIVDALPNSQFTVVQDTGCVPFAVQFVNNSTGATSYLWDFGNGGTSTLQNPIPNYNLEGSYNVTLHAYSQNGCESVKTINNLLKVWSVNAAFTESTTIGCPGTTIQFTTTGSQIGVTNWLWSFGDATTSTLQNPSHTYNTIGTYTVWLIARNSFGCKDTVYKKNRIRIVSGLVPYTVPDTMPICQNAPVSFGDPTIGSNVWNWNFGDGSTSTIQNPSHVYTTPGYYTVTLNTSMPGGCSQTFNPFAIVHVIQYQPEPIDINFISNCNPYVLTFSTTTPDVTSYSWDFGDGTTSTLASPTHTYQSAGIYPITLNMTIGAGCQTTISTSVVLGHPNPMSVNSNDICLGDISLFTRNNTAAFISGIWLFGDGQSSTVQNPTYTYTGMGVFTPQLITVDTSGCRDTFQLSPIVVNNPLPSFTCNLFSCINAPLQFQNTSLNADTYLWDFGDGSTSTDPNPSHIYTTAGSFTIILSATKNSCTRTITLVNYITVFSPLCVFNYTTNGQCLPVIATFTDSSPTAVAWLWDFGDGTSSSQQNPVHSFLNSPNGPIQLTVTDIHGCSTSQITTNITYYSASGTVDLPRGCIPHSVNFTDLSNSATAWLWDFGDGTTSNLQHPSHTYNGEGNFTVTLIATFPGNCIDTVIYPGMVTIETPTADFSSPTLAGCSPTQITFVNQSQDAVSYLWDFGDGGTSTAVDPSHIYYIPGYYTIKLAATNSFGCTDTIIKSNYIYIPGTYTQFTVSSLVACKTLKAAFIDSSINASSWYWNFGDGFIDSVQNPIHLYSDTGAYTVTLITRDSLGCSSSYTFPLPIQIYPDPIASATINNNIGCSSFTTSFVNQSLYADAYLWLFGDGDSSNATTPVHTYLNGGIYNPSIIAITQFGCRDTYKLASTVTVLQTPNASFIASDTIGCNPSSISFSSNSTLTQGANYNWDFGNGNTGNGINNQSTYSTAGTFSISLVTTNNNGCSDSASMNITINPTPVAAGLINISEGCQPLTVTFTDNSSGANSIIWAFGNGDTSNNTSPTYTYAIPGNFNPFLIANNLFGCSDTFNLNPSIKVHAVPVASITPDAISGCVPAQFTFTNSSTNLENPVYTWDFGDGTNSTAVNPSHSYLVAGNYQVRLIVTNTFGCMDDTTITISVYPKPNAIAALNTTTGCSPLTVNFSNNSLGADSYMWLYGDGFTDTISNPQHNYLSGGVFQPQLIAYTNFGCSDTFNLPVITIDQSPIVDFTSNVRNGCVGSVINFTNLTSMLSGSVYLWDFGFTQSNLQDPTIIYNVSGFYDVSLTVTNSNGCSSTYSETAYIEIFDTLPPPEDSILSVTVLNDTEVQITWKNSSANDLNSYILYRYNPLSGNYQVVYTDLSPANFSQKATSSYTERNLDTRFNTYTYKVQTSDFCNNALPLARLTAHTSVNITAQQSGQNIRVSWTPYGGCQVNTYEVWRTELPNGSPQLIVSLQGSVLNYLDTGLICPFNYSYRVTATNLCGSTFYSESDTSVAKPINILEGQHVEITRSTVINNKEVLTEWTAPQLHPERVFEYHILRTLDNTNFTFIASVPAGITSYIDNTVDVQEQEYYYQIVVVNDCQLSGKESVEGSSILLRGEHLDFKSNLNWTPYKEWQPGVENYTIERQRNDGTWELIQVVDGNITDIQLNE